MSTYAKNTSVSVAKSKEEIERTLARYGADSFSYATQRTADTERAVVQFIAHDRLIRLSLTFPPLSDFRLTPGGRVRKDTAAMEREHEQACRQRWRALNLLVKAKLEAVESGITTFEDEWLAHTVLSDGSTVSDFVQPQIAAAIEAGTKPMLLLTAGT